MPSHSPPPQLRVVSYLTGIKDAGKLIKEGQIEVGPVNMESIAEEVKAGQTNKESIEKSYDDADAYAKKAKIKAVIIGLIAIAIIAVLIIVVSAISNAIKEAERVQDNKERAQRVIQMIDELGEISLSSEPQIKAIENAYYALPYDARTYVTNGYIMDEARTKYENLVYEQREQETKDDPTRTITINDLCGRWKSGDLEWAIADFYSHKAVLYWISTQLVGAGIITDQSMNGTSYIVEYNNVTRRMKVKLFHYTMIGSEYLDVYVTKSKSGVLTMYYGNKEFIKQ